MEMQPESVPGLLERFGLQIGEELSGGWTPPAHEPARVSVDTWPGSHDQCRSAI